MTALSMEETLVQMSTRDHFSCHSRREGDEDEMVAPLACNGMFEAAAQKPLCDDAARTGEDVNLRSFHGENVSSVMSRFGPAIGVLGARQGDAGTPSNASGVAGGCGKPDLARDAGSTSSRFEESSLSTRTGAVALALANRNFDVATMSFKCSFAKISGVIREQPRPHT